LLKKSFPAQGRHSRPHRRRKDAVRDLLLLCRTEAAA